MVIVDTGNSPCYYTCISCTSANIEAYKFLLEKTANLKLEI
jgi:hypothetical protein